MIVLLVSGESWPVLKIGLDKIVPKSEPYTLLILEAYHTELNLEE